MPYRPIEPPTHFSQIRNERDLMLGTFDLTQSRRAVQLPKALFPEITAWLEIQLNEDNLFSEHGQLLFAARCRIGNGWKLWMTPHGYLQFDVERQNGFSWSSKIPLQSWFSGTRTLRMGLALNSAGWHQRNTKYREPRLVTARVRLLLATSPREPFTVCGEINQIGEPDLQAVPESIVFQLPGLPAIAGKAKSFVAYQTEKFEVLQRHHSRPAGHVFPATPCGSAFAPRWISDDTIEIFSRPGTGSSTGYWFHTRVQDSTGKLRRLRINPSWWSANMMPTFFARTRANGPWKRIVPSHIHMRQHGFEYRVELTLPPKLVRGCWLSCAIPFLEDDQEKLIHWVKQQPNGSVSVVSQSVEKRPIHMLRVGPSEARRHIIISSGQHSPLEIMTGHVLLPLLKEAKRLGLFRDTAFHIIPVVNVDCAHYGGSGMNLNQMNSNRHWLHDLQPETQGCVAYFKQLAETNCNVALAIDFHAGGIFRNHQIFRLGKAEPPKLSARCYRQQDAILPLLEEHAGLRICDGKESVVRFLRAADFYARTFQCPAFTIELGTCSTFDPKTKKTRTFKPSDLTMIGKGIARAIFAFE